MLGLNVKNKVYSVCVRQKMKNYLKKGSFFKRKKSIVSAEDVRGAKFITGNFANDLINILLEWLLL